MPTKNIIMIVDDIKLNIDILAENLSDEYTIMPATSGKTAMKMLERKKPDLVLLDVFMPEVDGFEVLKFIKERDDLLHIPVIFITGETDTVVEEKGYLLGISDYVRKPFNPVIIKYKIKNQLELRSYRRKSKLPLNYTDNKANIMLNAVIKGMALLLEHEKSLCLDCVKRIEAYTEIMVVYEKLRKEYSHDNAVEIIFSDSSDFDPIVLEAFKNCHIDFKAL